ncbi:MAG: glycoside hydrolase [Chloroflexi bacterium]|nr:glycoside hydrolase [Chloroflexota bacterium]
MSNPTSASPSASAQHQPTPITANVAEIRTAWIDWRDNHITARDAGPAPRLRVLGGVDIDSTTSEGQAYGILFASLFDEQALLDNLWIFANDHLTTRGLMHWHVGGYGVFLNRGAATDADVDMALGMLNACQQVSAGLWPPSTNGLDYCAIATDLINAIWEHEVDKPGREPRGGLNTNAGYELLPGDQWDLERDFPDGIVNLSYFSPGYFRLFAAFTDNPGWLDVIARGYAIAQQAQSIPGNCSRLVPNWNTYAGRVQTVPWHGETSAYWGWDAARFAWRVAVDRYWFDAPESRQMLNDIGGFFSSVGIGSVRTEYRLDGRFVQDFRTAFFTANAASAIWAAPNPTAVRCGQAGGILRSTPQQAYNQVVATIEPNAPSNATYYNNAWRLFALLLMSGNFPNLMTLDGGTTVAAVPPVPPLPTDRPTPTLIPTRQPTTVPPTNLPTQPQPTALPSAIVPLPTSTPITSAQTALRVQYYPNDATAISDNHVRPFIRIHNDGPDRVPLSELTLRYYVSIFDNQPLVFTCDYAEIGCGNLTGQFVAVNPPVAGATDYVEIGFSGGAGFVLPGDDSGQMQLRIHKANWAAFDELNDYSFTPRFAEFTDWPNITLYRNGVLVWGIEP